MEKVSAREAFAAALHRERRAQRLSIKALSEISGINANSIGLFEVCCGNPTLRTMELLADALCVDLVDMLKGGSDGQAETGL